MLPEVDEIAHRLNLRLERAPEACHLSNPEFVMMCKQILNSTLIGTVRVELVLDKRCIEVWPT